ncbi:hypothetical protein EV44_g1239 [Erysiphe necator]|uniref:Uncharacterized protein n=1 Tax=Uncinula necator TaxID=52586 RepID=A0A0B1P4S1_UNCNE|nr:hypothetical protein EV44_g1239 [Erysiphe necator]
MDESNFLTLPTTIICRGEMFVKRAWPEALFPQDVQDDVYTSVKNKVVLKPEWRLVVANSEVFNKLTQIQNALQIALIPYHLWTKRVTMDMSGDFHAACVWAIGRNPTWIELLETIFTMMQRLNVLYSPFTKFSLLTPQKNESSHTFAWRLRDAFYQLSRQDRESDTTREVLKELTMTHLPRVWTLEYPHTISTDNYELTETIVQISAQVTKWSNESGISQQSNLETDNLHLPSLETSSFKTLENTPDDVFATRDGTCYNCGKKGY